jgi:hypothetical protein
VPELPDVEGYGRTLRGHALGKRIRAVEAIDPAVVRNATARTASSALIGRAFVAEERRGKWLIARTTRVELLLHFGMTGRLEWLAPDDDLGRFARLRLEYSDGSLVYRDSRRLGGVWLCASSDEVSAVTGALGPDAFGRGTLACEGASPCRISRAPAGSSKGYPPLLDVRAGPIGSRRIDTSKEGMAKCPARQGRAGLPKRTRPTADFEGRGPNRVVVPGMPSRSLTASRANGVRS